MAAISRGSASAAWRPWQGVRWALCVAVLYFLAQLGAGFLRPPERVSPMWIPLGVLVGICLVTAPRNWRWIALGALAGSCATMPFMAYPPWLVLALGGLSLLAAILTTVVVLRAPSEQVLSRRRLVVLIVAGIPITWILLVLPMSWLIVQQRNDLLFSTLLAWNSASGTAVLTLVAPAIISMVERFTCGREFRPARVTEAVSRWCLLALSAFGAYWLDTGSGYPQALQFLPLPLLLWSALRFKLPGVAVDLFTLAFIAFAAVAHGHGPMASVSSDAGMFVMQLNFAALGMPMLFLAAVVAERAEAERKIAIQLQFEQLVSAVSSSMASCNPATLKNTLGSVLEKIGIAMDADRVVFGEAEEGSNELIARAHYRRSDPPFPQQLVISQRYPHLWETLKAGHVSNIPDVEQLPDEAAIDRDHFREVGIRSQLTVPVVAEGRVAFVLALASVRKQSAWSESQVPGLRVLAEALATASQRCGAEEDLRLTQYAVDRNPAMILRIDMEGRFVYANEAACHQLGYALAEMRQMHIWDISGSTTAQMWPMRSMQVREQGSASFESTYLQKDGNVLPIEIRTIHLRHSGGEFFFTFAFDIRARKAAQEAAHQHLKRMQDLATQMTHAEERQRRELAAILHDDVGQNLFAATTQLLAMRNGANGSLPAVDKVLSLLDQVTRDTRELTFELCPPVLYQIGLAPALQRLTDQYAARHRIVCTLEGSGDGPADLNTRGLAYQAVRELLGNAVRHGQAKHITVRLGTAEEAVTLEVADDGKGFDPTGIRPRGDTAGGFGLFHLRERVELLRGSLVIDSAPGKGCRVNVVLPLKPALVKG